MENYLEFRHRTAAIITDELVSGTRRYKNAQYRRTLYTLPTDQDQSIEIGDKSTDTGKTALLVVARSVLILGLTGYNDCVNDPDICGRY